MKEGWGEEVKEKKTKTGTERRIDREKIRREKFIKKKHEELFSLIL